MDSVAMRRVVSCHPTGNFSASWRLSVQPAVCRKATTHGGVAAVAPATSSCNYHSRDFDVRELSEVGHAKIVEFTSACPQAASVEAAAARSFKRWQDFHYRHDGRFFHPRLFAAEEFPELLAPSTAAVHAMTGYSFGTPAPAAADCPSTSSPSHPLLNVLEVGCGNGSNVYPLLQRNPSLRMHCSDFVPAALRTVFRNPSFGQYADRLTLFLWDAVTGDTPARPVDRDDTSRESPVPLPESCFRVAPELTDAPSVTLAVTGTAVVDTESCGDGVGAVPGVSAAADKPDWVTMPPLNATMDIAIAMFIVSAVEPRMHERVFANIHKVHALRERMRQLQLLLIESASDRLLAAFYVCYSHASHSFENGTVQFSIHLRFSVAVPGSWRRARIPGLRHV